MGDITKQNALREVHVNLFSADVEEIKRIAVERGAKWQVELRQLVRRALRGDRREVVVLRDGGSDVR